MRIFGRKKSGDAVRATARVVSSSQPPPHATYSPLKMDLVVQAEGLAPTAVSFSRRVARCSKFPVPGQTIPVEIDLADPSQVKVVWDEVPTRGQMGQQQSQAIAEAMRGGAAPAQPGGTVLQGDAADIVDQLKEAFPDATVNVAGQSAATSGPPAAGGDDRIAKLERLAQLHQSGMLSDEELAAEKARVLDEA